MKTWVKLYTEINHDPKVGTLSWAHRGILSALFALCGEIEDVDADGNETGALDTAENLAWRLRCERGELDAALAEFQARRIVHVEDGIVYLTHYAARQARPPSAKREAVRGRVRQWREDRRGCNDVTPEGEREGNEGVTHLEKIREDSDSEKNHLAADAAAPAAHDEDAPIRAEIARAWEQLNPRRQVTDLDRDQLADLCQEYGPPQVLDAIRRTNEQGKASLAYVRGVLRGNGPKPRSRASPSGEPWPLSDDERRWNENAGLVMEVATDGGP